MTSPSQDPNFRKLWAGQAISEIGSRITREGLPYTAVIVLGAQPMEMGFLAGVAAASVIVGAPLAGLLADRVHRRPLMILADAGRALLLISIPAAVVFGRLTMPHLYVVAFLSASLTVLFDIAYQSYVPSLVPNEQMLEANSKLTLTATTAEMVGPATTGLLVQWLTAPLAIALDSLSFLWSAAMIWWIRRPEPPPQPVPSEAAWPAITSGLRFISAHPTLRALALHAASMAFFFGFFAALYILFAIRELKLSPAGLGLVITAGGIGATCGALLASRMARRLGIGPSILAGAGIIAVATALVPLAHGPPACGGVVSGCGAVGRWRISALQHQ